MITGGIYFLFIFKFQAWMLTALAAYLSAHGVSATGWYMSLAHWVLTVSLLIVGAITFAWFATLISIPVNDFLAEAAEPHTTPPLPPSPVKGFSNRVRLLTIDLGKTIAAAILGIIVLLVSWIPLVNFLSLLISFLLVCFQFISYPQTRRGQGIRKGLGFLIQYPFACVGFGGVTTLLFTLPGVSFFFLPLAVVGGTLLFARASAGDQLPKLR